MARHAERLIIHSGNFRLAVAPHPECKTESGLQASSSAYITRFSLRSAGRNAARLRAARSASRAYSSP